MTLTARDLLSYIAMDTTEILHPTKANLKREISLYCKDSMETLHPIMPTRELSGYDENTHLTEQPKTSLPGNKMI